MTIDSYDPEYKEYSIYKTIRRAAGNIPFIVNTVMLGTDDRFQRVTSNYCEDHLIIIDFYEKILDNPLSEEYDQFKKMPRYCKIIIWLFFYLGTDWTDYFYPEFSLTLSPGEYLFHEHAKAVGSSFNDLYKDRYGWDDDPTELFYQNACAYHDCMAYVALLLLVSWRDYSKFEKHFIYMDY